MAAIRTFEAQWGGKTLSIQTGKYANQANGSCVVRYGDTIVLATAVMSESMREGIDFFPLMVEFEERLYAAGRIKGSRFIKKEGRPTDEAILVARYIDRAIRPLFDERMRNEVQVVVTCLAFDGENDPDVLGLIAASCALHMSDIPWNGPIADVRVGQAGTEWVLNPTYLVRDSSPIDLSFAGTPERIVMVEADAAQATEDTILEAFWFGMTHLAEPIRLMEEVRKEAGKAKRDVLTPKTEEEKAKAEHRAQVEAIARPKIAELTRTLLFSVPQASKVQRAEQKREIKKRTEAFLKEQGMEESDVKYGASFVGIVVEREVSRAILEEGKRVDGRALTQVRALSSEVGILPRVHGSGHFNRGETQVLSVVTLGAPGDAQTLDGMSNVGTKRYLHHYNFPPFAVGEVKPMRGPGRREIGHGALAEKAIVPVLPSKEDFPYTIRVVSEVLTSNGSSSMGSTCGSSLALMDAGVPITAPVAGVAMGLATDEKTGKYVVITDLQDLEDGAGGMDFKIAGTRTGITAIQMDTKTHGLTREMVEKTVRQARTGRLEILDVMQGAIAEPRPDLSPYAPRIITLRIDPERIGDVIGPGGKMINEIIATTGVTTIDIEDDGLVMITSMGGEPAQKAEAWIRGLTRKVVMGEVYTGKVSRLMDFGAFVEILPKKDGLVHISELAPWRVNAVRDIVKIGDIVQVRVKEIDEMGRINLTMKQVPGNTFPAQTEANTASASAPSAGPRPPRRA